MKDFDFKSFRFGKGNHASRDHGMCIMEAVSYVAGERHSDHPRCACPVLTKFLISWNDALPSDAERNRLLGEYVFRLVGTRSTKEIENRRAWMAGDWLIRECIPAWFDLVPKLKKHAASLRATPEIVDISTASNSISILADAKNAAWDAGAAWAAWDAAGAAWAAGAAAWAAGAAGAAWDAGAADIESTKIQMQISAQRLLDRMIALSETPKNSVAVLESAKGV